MADYKNIPLGLRTQTQIPLDVKEYIQNESLLSNLGVNGQLAYTYTKGLVVYCIEESTRWEWTEVKPGLKDTGLINQDFIYSDNHIAFGIDYSNKRYNFVKVTSGSETKVTAGTNTSVTGTGTIATPYVINSTDTNTTYSAGTAMSLVGTTFNNTAPDQTVVLTQGGATTITGTYPNFTITSTDSNTTYTAGTGLALTGTVFSVENLQKVITYPTDFTGTNYTLTNADNNYEIIINNGATAVSITVPSGLTSKIGVGFTQKGTGDVSYTASGTTINNPIGLKIKGQYYQTFLSQESNTNLFYLGGNTKI